MSVDEIMALDREYLTPAEVAAVIGCSPQDIRVTARQRPDLLGFNVCVVGTRTKIPRRGFLRWLEGREAEA